MPSKRPSRYITPEEWKKMSLKEREASSKAADDIAREEVEEEDKAERRKSKKEKKDKDKKKEKKDKKKKKDDEDGLKEMVDAFDALAKNHLKKLGHLETRIRLSPVPILPMMRFPLMVKGCRTTPTHIMKNGWSGRNSLANRKDRSQANQTIPNIIMKHWYV